MIWRELRTQPEGRPKNGGGASERKSTCVCLLAHESMWLFFQRKRALSRRPSINRSHPEMERRGKVAADSLAPLCGGGGG